MHYLTFVAKSLIRCPRLLLLSSFSHLSPRCSAVQLLSHVQLFVTPMDCSLPGSSVHCDSQASILNWAAISFSRGSSRTRDRTHVSCIGRQILYHRAIREALLYMRSSFFISDFSEALFFFNPLIWLQHSGSLVAACERLVVVYGL